MTPTRKTAAWVAICTACVAGFEGLRQNAYRDFNGIPTICFGETRGVEIGDRKTAAECKAMLEGRLYEFAGEVDRCCPSCSVTPERKAGSVSFAYNIGSDKFCRSGYVRLLNAGRTKEGCDELLKWTKASGVTLPGLVKRRAEERRLCLVGVGAAPPLAGYVGPDRAAERGVAARGG